ncbi:MAG TPA: cysteine synthase A [Blastocatellia bacterium]|nr:cysteine synthase A [Blastocatellia bacterium]
MGNWDQYNKYSKSILDCIGRTPLVRLNRVPGDLPTEILVKLEFFSPSGSLKDRIYLNMIERAEKRGDLKPGMTILECSTGNAGIACSFVAAVKGYKCMVVMPEGMSEERKKMDVAYGTEMVYTAGGESDVDLALQKLEELRSQDPGKYWVPSQFDNPDNIKAHFKTTGPEIWEQTRGKLDAYVATQGTGGQLTGIGRYLRKQRRRIRLYAGEPAECPLLSRREWGEHKIEGIGDGFVPRDLDLSLLDGIVTIKSEEALEMARRLAKEEGIFCGISSGANVVAALKVAEKHPEMKRIVTMICDSGQRYFSTELCGTPKHVDSPEREHPIDDYTREQLDRYQSSWEIID